MPGTQLREWARKVASHFVTVAALRAPRRRPPTRIRRSGVAGSAVKRHGIWWLLWETLAGYIGRHSGGSLVEFGGLKIEAPLQGSAVWTGALERKSGGARTERQRRLAEFRVIRIRCGDRPTTRLAVSPVRERAPTLGRVTLPAGDQPTVSQMMTPATRAATAMPAMKIAGPATRSIMHCSALIILKSPRSCAILPPA